MTITELQERVAAALNGCEELAQGRCKAFAEDKLSVNGELEEHLQTAQGIALVVVTPTLRRSGALAQGLPVETQLSVKCIEKPDLNRAEPGFMTALRAAEIVAHALDSSTFSFSGIDQVADDYNRMIVATATFNCGIILTN
jgi:hypothetical protein